MFPLRLPMSLSRGFPRPHQFSRAIGSSSHKAETLDPQIMFHTRSSLALEKCAQLVGERSVSPLLLLPKHQVSELQQIQHAAMTRVITTSFFRFLPVKDKGLLV